MTKPAPPTPMEPRLASPAAPWWRGAGVWVVLLVVLLALGFQGVRGLWEPDEGRYVAVAMQMLRSGDWMHPALFAEMPHYSKPPMTYWLLAGAIGLVGRFEFAARLPVGLAFAAAAVGVGLIARRLLPGRGLIATVIYATSALPFIAANIITTDTFLTCFEIMAMVGFVYAWTAPAADVALGDVPPPTPRARPPLPAPGPILRERLHLPGLLLMWAGFGLAFFTKGPPGLLPLLAVIPVVGWTVGWRQVPGLFHPAGLGLFLVLGFAWYLVIVAQDPALARYFLIDEVVNRVASNEHHRNAQWWKALMYLPILAGGLLPWSLDWLRPGSWRAVTRQWRRRHPAVLLAVAWVAIPLGIFMLSESRLPLYVLPLAAPLVLLCAPLQPLDWLSQPRNRGFIFALAALLMGLRLTLGLVPNHKDARAVADRIPTHHDTREVVFVSNRPVYGVSLYTNKPVEAAPLTHDKNIEQTYRLLPRELAEREGRLTFMIPTSGWPRARSMFRQHRWQVLDIHRDPPFTVVDARPRKAPPSRLPPGG